jgi:predicted GNAT superfamily acetyltransferase
MRDIVVRPLSRPSEFVGAEEVQLSAWGEDERAVTPKEIMIAIHDNGGVVLGAFDGNKTVGFAILLPGYNGKKVYMYSHMTGVLKEYQSRGVGYLLKQKQREIALERGFDLVAWTFDPMIARNAYFNFRKLGVVCRNYIVDYYGPMRDPVNRGLPTDRFLCEWFIRPARLRKVRSYASGSLEGAHAVIERVGDEPHPLCRSWDIDVTVEKALVDIPRDIVEVKRRDLSAAQRWRRATREAFQAYFSAGFSAVALLEAKGQFRYLLLRADLPKSIFPARSLE